MKRKLGNIVTVFLYAIFACLLVWLVFRNGIYPSGSDTLCHIYKGDILYKEILKGNLYPLIDPLWYNGVEMLRYWAPLPVYFLALCEAIAGGNLFYGYLLFVGCVFFFGACVWLIIGNRHGRMILGAFLGFLWFFMPNNLTALFVEGNLPRSLCMIFLPWLVEQIYLYLSEKRWRNLLGIILTFLPITLCHLGYAGMILLAVLLFLIIYAIRYGGFRKCFHVLVGMVLSILILGLWVYPSLQGGITSTDSSQVMKTFFQDAIVSLNPLYRIEHGVGATFYFGLAAFLTLLPGIFFGKNKSSVYFVSALAIFICTTNAMYPILSHLPGSQYLWMLRFISIALCMILFGLILWDTLKKRWLSLFCVLLVLDTLPSLSLVYGNFSGQTVETRMDDTEAYTLLAEAKEITTQRLALMDLSSLGATGAYLTSDYGQPLAATFGAGWQSANTANNIMMLNEAMETGRYYYLFDRCLAMGNDSVIIRISKLQYGNRDLEKVIAAARTVGYELVSANDDYQLYHMDTPEQFGTVSRYNAIGIGKAAGAATMDYPSMEWGDSYNLNDYSFEDLKQYQLVFLNGFTYENKTLAEDLVTQLSEYGIRVVIEADGMPVDEHTGIQSFLGVVCQPMSFSNGFPLLDTIDGVLDCSLFPRGYASWKAMYLNGLDECWGKIQELDENLEFYGTVKNDNIVMIGFNLSYYYSLTRDESIGKLLSHSMTIPGGSLPDRTPVPLDVQYEKNKIIIRSDYDNVNTGVAYHDIFSSDADFFHKNNLIYVNRGETVIKLHYPYLWESLGISAAAVAATVIFLIFVRLLWSKRYVKRIEITGVVRPVKGAVPCFEAAVPSEVKYKVEKVTWYDAQGANLDGDAVFKDETYRIQIRLCVDAEEHFDKEVKSTVNGLKVEHLQFLETDKRVLVEMSYQAIDPFAFLQQPTDLDGVLGEPVTVTWMISKTPKVGYLQVLERESWIIYDTVSKESGTELSASITYDGVRKCRYRLIYITAEGKSVCSDEFSVTWKEKKTEKE